VSGDRAHMAEIGREGGHRRQALRSTSDTPSNDEKEGHSEDRPPVH
jgi:hypothetical protein